jgi:tRNA threonylcarbamoyladenosine dehydratase
MIRAMAADNERRFGGIDRLYGTGSVDRLGGAHVCVVGIGGVGSWAAEALARSGVGRLTLIDLDHVAESNINRQAHALSSTLGQAKVLAMAARVRDIHPGCQLATIEEFVTPDNLAAVLPPCNVVVDAIDQVKAKAALIAHCRSAGQALVTTGGAGGKTDPTMIRVADLALTTQDALAASLRAELRKQHGFPRQGPFGVECVYSIEPGRPATTRCDADLAHHGLNCAGYGSSLCLTGSFGFAAASRALLAILRP